MKPGEKDKMPNSSSKSGIVLALLCRGALIIFPLLGLSIEPCDRKMKMEVSVKSPQV